MREVLRAMPKTEHCPFCGGVTKVANNYWVRCKDCKDDCFLETVQLKDIQLMAAAPEMYELLDDAMTELASIVNNYELTEEDTRDAIAVCKKFDALWRRIKGKEEAK